jgi:hypothetical protein
MDGRLLAPNLVRVPERESAGEKYERVTNQIARRFIYDEGELDPIAIERAIETAKRDPDIRRREEQLGELETIHDLLQGIAGHERTNELHYGAWQAVLARREPQTREQVEKEFDAFAFKKTQLFYENEALKHYARLLERNPAAEIRLSETIRIDHTDIEALLIDLRIRQTERLQDETERRRALADLDRELAALISRLPPEQAGKRLELEELYLLRRLIHGADTGHRASADHGTPREDLRPDQGSVDLLLAAGGDVFEFQMKTFKSGTHREAKEIQAGVIERAQRKLAGSDTRLVILEQEAVRGTYDAALRQGDMRHSLSDKYATLEPLVESLDMKERVGLLALFGLTEDDLAREKEESERRQASRLEHEEAMRAKREEEERRFAEGVERIAAKQRAALDAEREREARIASDKENKLRESMERMENEKSAAEAKRLAAIAKQQAAQAEILHKQEEAKRQAAKAETKAIKDAEKKWVQIKLDQLGKPDALIEQGFLAKEKRNEPAAILAAKKLLAAKYPNPKSVLKDFPFEG